jgi:hypothetical protein
MYKIMHYNCQRNVKNQQHVWSIYSMCTTNIELKVYLQIPRNSQAYLDLRRQKCAGVKNAFGRR